MSDRWTKMKRLFWQPPEEHEEDVAPRVPPELSQSLVALQDVEGVIGSVIIDRHGLVVAANLPSVFDEEAVHQVGRRMVELRLAVEQDPQAAMAGTLEFEGCSFQIKAFATGMVGVLFDESAKKPALGMALNLVSRRVASSLGETGQEKHP